ncbi:MAG: Rieske 2Fe-2S domain-containing protein [Steroidobacteraceae bacterium]
MSRLLPAGTVIANVAGLSDGAARGFSLTADEWPQQGLVVRVGDALHVYVNRCPHALRHLNFLPDHFLTRDGEHIQCNAHGALFEKHTGLCVAGPCLDESLRRLPVTRVADELRLTEALDLDRLERNPFLSR